VFCLGPFVFPSKTKHPSSACISKLNQIGMACEMYRMDHEGAQPGSFADLSEYISDPGCFTCPRTQEPGEMPDVERWTPYSALKEKKGFPIRSYPEYSWTFDTIMALASLDAYDRIHGTATAPPLVRAHLDWIRRTGTHRETGLPYSIG